jgi:hypothetical protein
MTRKPRSKKVLNEMADNMAHFSRVNRAPVWFSFNDLWDIHKKTRRILTGRTPRSMTTAQGFPTSHQFSQFAGKHPRIQSKRITVKINHDQPKTHDNIFYVTIYAFIHPTQNADDGVRFGGVA